MQEIEDLCIEHYSLLKIKYHYIYDIFNASIFIWLYIVSDIEKYIFTYVLGCQWKDENLKML